MYGLLVPDEVGQVLLHDRNRAADTSVQRRYLCADAAAAVFRTGPSAWPLCDLGSVGIDRLVDLDADVAALDALMVKPH